MISANGVVFNGTKAQLLAVAEDLLMSRKSFKHFLRRCIIEPRGWVWTSVLDNLCDKIEWFLGPQKDKRLLCISILPRAGKSVTLQALSAWLIGNSPMDAENMYISYSLELARDNLRAVRQIMETKYYKRVFPRLVLDVNSADGLMVKDKPNGKFNIFGAGVGGAITGRGISERGVGIVDDPIKGEAEASSPAYKKQLIDWWNSVFISRLAPGAKAIVCQTRFATDDLCGYISLNFADEAEIINYPALIRQDNGEYRSLIPERFSVDELLFRRKLIGSRAFDSLYMGAPTPMDGGLVKAEWLKTSPAGSSTCIRVRAWDLAGTKDGGDFTSGCLMSFDPESGQYVVEDLVHVQLSPAEVQKLMKQTAEADGVEVSIFQECEPGSAGKSLCDTFARHLFVGYDYHYEHPTGSKEVRAKPMIAAIENATLTFVQAHWTRDLWDEMLQFPFGEHDDALDSVVHAYNWLTENGASDAGNIYLL